MRYGPSEVRAQEEVSNELILEGESYINWNDRTPTDYEMGSKRSGIFIYELPEEFDPGYIVLEVEPTTDTAEVVTWRLGEKPDSYDCPSTTPEPTNASLEDTITSAGLNIDIKQVLTPSAEGESVLVVDFEVENTSNFPRIIPDVKHAEHGDGRNLRIVPIMSESIVIGDEEFVGLYRDRYERRSHLSSRKLFPEDSVSGVYVWDLPNGVSGSDVTLTVEFEDEEAYWSLK